MPIIKKDNHLVVFALEAGLGLGTAYSTKRILDKQDNVNAKEQPAGESPITKNNEINGKIPSGAKNVERYIKDNNGAAPKGYKGGRKFENDGREGGQILQKETSEGTPINYREYDIHPFKKGTDRGTERVVRGSDGKSYYTSDHYKTFTEIK